MQIPFQSSTPTPASYGRPKHDVAIGSECETTVPYDYSVDYAATKDRETIGQTYQQAIQIHQPHKYIGRKNPSAKRSNRLHESMCQTDQLLRPTLKPDESQEHLSEFFRNSDIEKYIRASRLPVLDAAITRKRERSIVPSPLISDLSGEEAVHHNKKSSLYRMPSANLDSALNLFGEGWLMDANCVGSSVAEMWKSDSESSDCATTSLATLDFGVDTQDVNDAFVETDAPTTQNISDGFVETAIRRELAWPCTEEHPAVIITQDANATTVDMVPQRLDVPNKVVAIRRIKKLRTLLGVLGGKIKACTFLSLVVSSLLDVSTSTAEAELLALSGASREMIWWNRFFEARFNPQEPMSHGPSLKRYIDHSAYDPIERLPQEDSIIDLPDINITIVTNI
ncbi:hypothetical protein EG328_004122 [Venturia inaequalis]|uniref:Uncharacterized protein n=1 Tax=Venturia inaequalis TaxID=5025 RepID=A0A8H3VE00_VENIN|nr:hypothetical protein EG328_004122 [Venturia inaequalis]